MSFFGNEHVVSNFSAQKYNSPRLLHIILFGPLSLQFKHHQPNCHTLYQHNWTVWMCVCVYTHTYAYTYINAFLCIIWICCMYIYLYTQSHIYLSATNCGVKIILRLVISFYLFSRSLVIIFDICDYMKYM